MSCLNNVCIVIPSYEPTERLEATVDELISSGFGDIVLVDDGSGEKFASTFEKIAEMPQCSVLTHPRNMGKGAALKTAFSYFIHMRTDMAGVITVDGDGQHLAVDVVKCAKALLLSDDAVVIGARNFHHPDAPMRNSIGNRTTAFAFRALFGILLKDTQTGLRGIPMQYVQMMLGVDGNRFEYETNMLIELKHRGINFLEIDIETVYEEGSNERSHFRPFIDSLMIFSRIFKYSLSSVISFVVDISAFSLAMRLLGAYFGPWSIPGCTVIARAISSFLNFNINGRVVFQRKKVSIKHFIRYYMLAACQMLVSAAILWLLALISNSLDATGFVIGLKILVDTALFFLSYLIQRNWVFRMP